MTPPQSPINSRPLPLNQVQSPANPLTSSPSQSFISPGNPNVFQGSPSQQTPQIPTLPLEQTQPFMGLHEKAMKKLSDLFPNVENNETHLTQRRKLGETVFSFIKRSYELGSTEYSIKHERINRMIETRFPDLKPSNQQYIVEVLEEGIGKSFAKGYEAQRTATVHRPTTLHSDDDQTEDSSEDQKLPPTKKQKTE